MGVRGEFHFTCAAFKVTSKHPGGTLQKKIERLGLRRNYFCCCWHQGPGNGQGYQRESVEQGGEEGFGDATLKYSVEGKEEQALMTELAACRAGWREGRVI